MSSIILPRKRLAQPRRGAVDSKIALTRGLGLIADANGRGFNVRPPVFSGDYSLGPSLQGLTHNAPPSSIPGYAYYGAVAPIYIAGDFTICLFGAGGANAAGIETAHVTRSGGTLGSTVLSVGGSYARVTLDNNNSPAATVDADRAHVIVGIRRGNQVRLYVDGDYIGQATTGTRVGNITGFGFGRASGNNQSVDRHDAMAAIWARGLSDDDVRRLSGNVWQLFAPDNRIAYFDVGASGGIAGSGAITESGEDAAAGTGAVAISGGGAVNESGDDIVSGSGATAISGSGDIVESGNDTAAGSGSVSGGITGSGAITESGEDAAAGTGAVAILGSGAISESGDDIATGSGNVAISGSGYVVESGADTAAGGGTVSGGIVGGGAITESGEDAAAGTGAVAISGGGAVNESGNDVVAGSGAVAISGSGDVVESGADTAAGGGTVSGGITGSGAIIESGEDAAAGTGAVAISGGGAVNESGNDVVAGSGNAVLALARIVASAQPLITVTTACRPLTHITTEAARVA